MFGEQVFYNAVPGSQELAEAVQSALNEHMNERQKEAKQVGSEVYLMEHTEIPSILVECGFLSNAQDTALLNTQAYQTKLALTILSAARSNLW